MLLLVRLVGIMARVDEIVFHQILAWHHFYDHGAPMLALASDGLLHAAELIIIVAGFVLFSRTRRDGSLRPQWAWAGFFLGAGGFQIFDGVIDHKVLRIHQIRYGVASIIPYDIAWISVGALLLLVGVLLLLRAARDPAAK